ncbi:hypothetical protein ACFYOT_01515 [Saccharothrix saharensis]|uniref:hypothetical protein n=1 Tax=Saccharothrix saharensis TaxID=571190 RepID=UPI003690085B
MSTRLFRLGALAVSAALTGLLLGGAAAAEPVATVPNLDVTATFDRESYRTADVYKLTVTIRNTGAEPLTGLVVVVNTPENGWGGIEPFAAEFANSGPGGTLAAGETRRAEFFGNAYVGTRINTSVTALQRPANKATVLRFTAPVTEVRGTVSGRVFADRNFNGAFDDGEAVAGRTVLANPTYGSTAAQTTTDADGRFSLDLLIIEHWIQVVNDSPLITFEGQEVEVSETGNPELAFLGELAPDSSTLDVEMSFTQSTYAPGAEASLHAVVTNQDRRPATGVQAFCEGGSFYLGAVEWRSRDVTIAPGGTFTFVGTATVPGTAVSEGEVRAKCGFGFDRQNSTWAYASASVPGGTGALHVTP